MKTFFFYFDKIYKYVSFIVHYKGLTLNNIWAIPQCLWELIMIHWYWFTNSQHQLKYYLRVGALIAIKRQLTAGKSVCLTQQSYSVTQSENKWHKWNTRLQRGNEYLGERMSEVVNQRVLACPPPAKITGERMSAYLKKYMCNNKNYCV